jgi:hypothetical protein
MTPSDKMKDQAETAWADYDAHLTKAEDHLEAAARKGETAFDEHTAVPEAHLERTEDYLEAAADKAEMRAAKRGQQHDHFTPPGGSHMSTHADPSKDEYLELEKKLGAAEYELAANLAETDKTLDAAVKKGKKQAKAARAQLKQKVDAKRPQRSA